MILSSSIGTCIRNISHLRGCVQRQMINRINLTSNASSNSCSFFMSSTHPKLKCTCLSIAMTSCYSSFNGFQAFQGRISKSTSSPISSQKRCLKISLVSQNMHIRFSDPKQGKLPKIKFHVEPMSWPQGCASAGLILGLVCCSNSEPVHAEAPGTKCEKKSDRDSPSSSYSHGKKVYTDYSVIGVPGDGRCLFRSIAHGACLRSGKPTPNESQQRELADELRARVADEFIKRQEETEWFIEGDFNTYVSQIRKPHVWGGEPELLMASHVLQMPITVYIYDRDSGGLISIAEYGQQYNKENPIKVLYHGYGHYDTLQIPGKKDGRSRL